MCFGTFVFWAAKSIWSSCNALGWQYTDPYTIWCIHTYLSSFAKNTHEFILKRVILIQHYRAYSSLFPLLCNVLQHEKPGSYYLEYSYLIAQLSYTHEAVSEELTLTVMKRQFSCAVILPLAYKYPVSILFGKWFRLVLSSLLPSLWWYSSFLICQLYLLHLAFHLGYPSHFDF